MAKKHKHEEHVNHERWVISFADMMTLLFALFVVLYAMGVQDLEKLKELKKSGGGEVAVPAPLVTAQDGEMREFMKDTLVDYEEIAGRSIEIRMTDDSVTMTAPLSDFFEAGKPYPIRREVQTWLGRTVDGSLAFASDIHILIEATEVVIGRTAMGAPVTSLALCFERLNSIEKAVRYHPQIRDGMVGMEFRRQKEGPGGGGDWERAARVTITFSNTRGQVNGGR
jgi:hypothetical protein